MSALLWPIAVALFLAIFPILIEKGRISLMVILVPGLCQILVSYAAIDLIQEKAIWVYYALSIAALLLGYYGVQGLAAHTIRFGDQVLIRKHSDGAAMGILTDLQRRRMTLFCCFVGCFVFYHFAVGGIPAFSPDVETVRFDFTSSGLFGIPGRMSMFGWPFVVLLVSFYYWRTRDESLKSLFYTVWGVFLLISLASGFKSSLVQVLTLILLSRIIAGKPIYLTKLFSRRFMMLYVAAVGYAGWMSFRYGSIGLTGMADLVNYMKLRAGVLAAVPGYYTITSLPANESGHLYLVQDLLYTLHKYFHIGMVSADTFPLDKIVSSALYNTPLSADAWIVPVTIGGFAQLYADAGLVGALVLMVLTGIALAYAVLRCTSKRTPFSAAALGLGIQMIMVYLLNGNLVYVIVNCGAVLAFLFGLDFLALLVALRIKMPRLRHSPTGID
ncbi:MAG: hypothetical protein ACYC2Y_08665 [Armatimonadota bacterium]